MDGQCPNGGNAGTTDLVQCKEKCRETPGCTAVSINPDECVMRKCALPVPEPGSALHGYSGYHLADEFVGPTVKIWKDEQCPSEPSLNVADLNQCKEKCRETSGCTAVNFNPNVACVMQKCALPVPEPEEVVAGYTGYHLAARELKNNLKKKT